MKTTIAAGLRVRACLVASLALAFAGCGGGGIEEGMSKDAPKGAVQPAGFADMQKDMGANMLKATKQRVR